MLILQENNLEMFGRLMKSLFWKQEAGRIREESYATILQILQELGQHNLGNVELRAIFGMCTIALIKGSSYCGLGSKPALALSKVIKTASSPQHLKKVLNGLESKGLIVAKSRGNTKGFRIPLLEKYIKTAELIATINEEPSIKVEEEFHGETSQEVEEKEITAEDLERAGLTESGLQPLQMKPPDNWPTSTLDQQRRLAEVLKKIPPGLGSVHPLDPVSKIEGLLEAYLGTRDELEHLRKGRSLLIPRGTAKIFKTANWPKITKALEVLMCLEDINWNVAGPALEKFSQSLHVYATDGLEERAEHEIFDLVEDALLRASHALKAHDPEARIVMFQALSRTPLIMAMAKLGYFKREGQEPTTKCHGPAGGERIREKNGKRQI